MPGFWLFREPMSKLGQLLVLFGALLLALADRRGWPARLPAHRGAVAVRWRAPSAALRRRC
ncbi:MAG: hypothetical protein V9E93_16605 [Steroidobacteraceae bacterium]